jgi:AcrR family transcriptional regulator
MDVTVPKGTRPRRTQAERRDQSERGLVRAVIEIVGEQGVSAATVDAIARRGGFSRGLVGQRFGSKSSLIEAVIAYIQEERERVLWESGLGSKVGLDALMGYLDIYVEQLARLDESKAYFRLLSWAVADAATALPIFAQEHARVAARLQVLIEQAQVAGEVHHGVDARAAAVQIGSQVLGIAIQLLIDPSMQLEAIRTTLKAAVQGALTGPNRG